MINIDETISKEDESEKNLSGFQYNKLLYKSDILFYIEGAETVLTKANKFFELNKNKNEDNDPTDYNITKEIEYSKSKKYPIYKNDLQEMISNLYATFNDLSKRLGPNYKEPEGGIDGINDFSLDEIELNLNIEAGTNIFFTLNTRGSAGLKLIFKRK